MTSRVPPPTTEVQRYRTLVWVMAAYLAALPLATLWGLIDGSGVPSSQVAFVVVALGVALAALATSRAAGPRAGFAASVVGGFAVVTFGMYHDAGTAGVTWAAYVGLLAVVALSPANRWTLLAAAVSAAGVLGVALALALEGADRAAYDPFKAVSIVCLLTALAVLARNVSVPLWARGDAAISASRLLEAAVDRADHAQRAVSAELREMVDDVAAAAAHFDSDAALARIVADADAATALVDDMLEASRLRTGLVELQLEPLDPERLRGVRSDGRATVEMDPVYVERAMRAAAGGDVSWHAAPDGAGAVLVARAVAEPSPVSREIADCIVEAHGGWIGWDGGVVEIVLPGPGAAGRGPPAPTRDSWEVVLEQGLDRAIWTALPAIAAALVFTALSIGVRDAPGTLGWMLVCTLLWGAYFAADRTGLMPGIRAVPIVLSTLVIAGLVASTGGVAGSLWLLVLIPSGMTIVLSRPMMLGLGAFACVAMAAAVVPTMPDVYRQAIDVPIVLPIFTVLMLVPASRGFDRIAARVEAANTQLAAQRRETTTFLSVIAHELRTPLTSMRAAAESLAAGGWPTDVETEFADTIRTESARLGSLVDDLDSGAERRLEDPAVEAERVDVEPVVAAAAAVAGAVGDGAHTITTDVEGGLGVVADPARLREVLDNLLSNALRYSSPGTEVVVRARSGDAGMVAFEVADRGPGVSPGDRDHVFERYWRATGSPGHGTGLGLAIAQALVEAHGPGCRIVCSETPGGGATFAFTLPAPVGDLSGSSLRR